MKRVFKKIAGFFQKHPGIKTTAVGVLGAAATAASNGAFGPKGVVIAGAASAVIGLFVRRPQDGGPEVEGNAEVH